MWTVEFKTIANRKIRIRIVTNGTNVNLQPSANPFTLEEEGKDDLFNAVRRQTGYIGIITDDISLVKNIMPNKGGERKVYVEEEVSEGNYRYIFVGYVQPKILSFKAWKGKHELRIPVECCLSALKYNTDKIIQTNIVPVYTILSQILLYKGSNAHIDNVWIQGNMMVEESAADEAKAWLRKKLYTSIFDGMTHLKALEAICNFFGWTCRTFGRDVCLISCRNIDSSYVNLTGFKLSDLISGNLSTHTTGTWNEITFSNSAIASDDILLKYAEGVRDANIECPINAFNEEYEFPDHDIKVDINNGDITSVLTNNQSKTGGSFGLGYSDYHYGISPSQYDINNEWQITEWYNVDLYLQKNDSQDVEDWNYNFSIYDTLSVNFNSHNPVGYVPNAAYHGYMTIKKNTAMNFSVRGILNVKPLVEMHELFYVIEDYTPVVLVGWRQITEPFNIEVKIGNLWFNYRTNEWQTTQVSMPCNPDQGQQLVVPANLQGQLTIKMYNITSNRSIVLSGMELSFTAIEGGDIDSSITKLEYSAHNKAFSVEKNFNTLLCMKKSYIRKSKNVLLNMDETECEGLYELATSSNIIDPLQKYVNEVISETSPQKTYMEMTVRRDIMPALFTEVLPTSLIYITELDTWYYVLAISYQLRDEKVKLKLIERDYQRSN